MPKDNKPKNKQLTRSQKQIKIAQEYVERTSNSEYRSPYQDLFEHMSNEHGLILLESEMDDITHLCKSLLGSKVISHA